MNDKVDLAYSSVVDRAVNDYGDHTGFNRARVVGWLAQFPEGSRDLAAKMLGLIRYHPSSNVRNMARQLVASVFEEYPDVSADKVYFVPIGSAGSGSQIVARHIKGLDGVRRNRVINLFELLRLRPDGVEVIVFIDDFSGTGDTIRQWWENIEPLVLPIEARNVTGILVVNQRAFDRLVELFDSVLFVNFLDESANVFDQSCSAFTSEEKDMVLAACRQTGCGDTYLQGWGSCGLLFAFSHGCPNNSLPILWFQSDEWLQLFQRRS